MEEVRKISKKRLDNRTHRVHSLHMNNQLTTTTPKIKLSEMGSTGLVQYVVNILEGLLKHLYVSSIFYCYVALVNIAMRIVSFLNTCLSH